MSGRDREEVTRQGPTGRRLFVFDDARTLAGAPGRRQGMDDDGPWGVICVGGEIEATGPAVRLRREYPGIRALEFPGAVATPGLADGHLHLLEWALEHRHVDLGDAGTPAEAARRVAGRAMESSGEWVRGYGWRADVWQEFPHRSVLDRELSERPVALRSHDMHAWWVNSRALRELGIHRDTPDPPGGEIVRDDAGEPAGVLVEAAGARVVEALRSESRPGVERRALQAAQARLHRWGVTRVHSMEMPSETFSSLGLLSRMEAEGTLELRVLQHLPVERLDEAAALGLRSGYGSKRLKIGCVKSFLDGTLGCRTAWMKEPYRDAGGRGDRLLEPGELRRRAARAASHGLATAVHAIGDAAVEHAVEVLSSVPAGPGGRTDDPVLPHRVEHGELVTEQAMSAGDPGRLIYSVQPAQLLSDRRAAAARWGEERCRRAFPFRSLLERGFSLVFGSDAPVEEPDPMVAIHAAVGRGRDPDGEAGPWNPGESVSRSAALRALTVAPARSAGEGPLAGRLVPGGPADFVAWRGDPLNRDVALPDGPQCVATVLAGELVWAAGESCP